jgi:hypothetical protein
MRNGIFILVALFLVGCESEPEAAKILTVATTTTSTTTTTTIYKEFFSQWDQNGAPGHRLPLIGKTYNQTHRDTIFQIDTGTQCICDILAVGSPQYTLTLSACSGTGCGSLPNTYTWTNSNGTLTICELSSPSACMSFR